MVEDNPILRILNETKRDLNDAQDRRKITDFERRMIALSLSAGIALAGTALVGSVTNSILEQILGIEFSPELLETCFFGGVGLVFISALYFAHKVTR